MNNEDTFTFHEATGLWFDYHKKSKAWRIMRDMYLVNTQGCAPWEPEYYENREAVVAELDKRALSKKTKVEFKPRKRADGRFAIEIFINDFSTHQFVHWIETTDRTICKISNHEFVMSPIFSEDECMANCNWLNNAYLEGKIK